MSKPLENIKVLDLTRVLAGPFCTMVLSDMGAEIIKVEIPGRGDDSREFGPFMNGKSLYFININRCKKSISIDLKKEKGRKLIHDLVKRVDVVIENFLPGTMERLGIGYNELKRINPKLIYASISGFGHTGPESKKPAYDILAQAMGGIMSITGWPETPPTRIGISIGDITASLYTAIGITSALYHRTITGKGEKIDVAMLDCQISILENALARFQVNNASPEAIGNRHPAITPFQAFKAKDRYFVIAAGNDIIWKRLCKAINREDLIENEKFKTNNERTKNVSELVSILEKILEKKTCDQWIEIFEKEQVPCSPINNIEMAMNNKQIKARNMIVEADDNQAGRVKIAGNPIKMSSIPEEKTRSSVPEIGEHNEKIFKEMLGLSDKEIDDLRKDNVI